MTSTPITSAAGYQQHGAVVLFYKYFDPRRSTTSSLLHQYPEFYLKKLEHFQKDLCNRLGLKGRILLASEGINGTLSGLSSQVLAEYRDCMEKFDLIERYGMPMDFVTEDQKFRHDNSNSHTSDHANIFSNIDWKDSSLKLIQSNDRAAEERILEPFPDLKISIVKELISTGGTVSVEDIVQYGGTHLSPQEFHEKLKNKDNHEKAVVIIDVRNTFEHDIGHFVNPTSNQPAMNPEMVTFSSFDPQFCQQHAPLLQDKTVLMYCTGGIRCEKASVMLKKRGVSDVFQLRGGIHRYLETFGDDGYFRGRNFVFDQRVAVSPSEHYEQQRDTLNNNAIVKDESISHVVVGKCIECRDPFDEISGSRLCTVCRDLVLICPKCQDDLREFHCRRHRDWKNSYFTFLEVFTEEQLQSQKEGLERLLSQPKQVSKNVRHTLKRQLDKVKKRIQAVQSNPSLVNPDAPRHCRTCLEPNTICNGLCWGFWKTTPAASQNPLLESVEKREGTTRSVIPVHIGDKVMPGPDWNEVRFGDPIHPSTGQPLEGTVIDIKSWGAGSSGQDCVTVKWDNAEHLPRRRRQPQIYRWGFVAANGAILYDVQHQNKRHIKSIMR